MKRSIFSHAVMALTLGAVIFSGCTSRQDYRIKGVVAGAADGDSVFMLRLEGRQYVPQDTAIVRQGQFEFQGRQDSAVIQVVSYAKEKTRFATDFFLEPGTIRIHLDEESQATGTPNNDAYQAFKDRMNSIQAQAERLYAALQQEEDETRRDSLTLAMSDLDTEVNEAIAGTIRAQADKTVGQYLLANYHYYLEYAEIDSLLAILPARAMANPSMQKLAQLVEKSRASEVGKPLVDFTLPDVEGTPTRLADLVKANTYTIIDFWASWCGPCRRAMPSMLEFYAKYHDRGLGIVGVSLDSDADNWKRAIAQHQLPWPQLSDLQGWESEAADLYAVRSIPFIVLVDAQGVILARGLDEDALRAKLQELMPEK